MDPPAFVKIEKEIEAFQRDFATAVELLRKLAGQPVSSPSINSNFDNASFSSAFHQELGSLLSNDLTVSTRITQSGFVGGPSSVETYLPRNSRSRVMPIDADKAFP